MHLLQLCPRVPYPPTDGGAIAMYDVAAGLAAAGHRVTVLAINTPKHRQPADALAHLGPHVRLVTVDVDTNLKPRRALRNLLFGALPYNVERFVSRAVAARLAELLRTEAVDVVQVEGTFVAWYVDVVRRAAPGVPVVLRAHNVEHTIWHMLSTRQPNPLKARYLRHLARGVEAFERRYLPRFDAVAAITAPDQQRLLTLGCPEPVVFIPAGANLQRLERQPDIIPEPHSLFMLASFDWLPNQEGLDWLLAHVWPRVRAQHPALTLHLAGKNMPTHVQQLHGRDNLVVHGFVDSAAAFMQRYGLMLVPLLSGGGMRVKIIEGLALGTCILSTSLGAEGISVRSGHDILLADAADDWVAQLGRYARGELPVARIGAEAAATAALRYDNRRVVGQFVALYRQLGAAPAERA